MADQSLYHTHRSHDPVIEYRVYFAVILVLSMPSALVKWSIGLVRRTGAKPNPGVLDRALSDARAITPMIFSA